MKKLLGSCLLLGLLLATGCGANPGRMTVIPLSNPVPEKGSGAFASATQPANGFNTIRMETFGEVQLLQGPQESFKIEGDDNLIQFIETSVENGVLIIRAKTNQALPNTKPPRFLITVQTLKRIEIPASGIVNAPDPLQIDELSIDIDGEGMVNLNQLSGRKVETSITGTGVVTLRGVLEEDTIQISGSGSYHSAQLTTQQTRVDFSGSGEAYVAPKTLLQVKINGDGIVYYYGSPKIEQEIQGGGKLVSAR